MALVEIIDLVDKYVRFMADEGENIDVSPKDLQRLRSVPIRNICADGMNTADIVPADNTNDKGKTLAGIAARISTCESCDLHKSRTKTVAGEGSENPQIMFIGEAPGADEDIHGKPFVGRAGHLLTKMIQSMGYSREDVFIGNILKCRPPGNRNPLPDEIKICLPYLKEQIQLLKPQVIIALGGTAVRGLFDITTGITQLRGKWLLFEDIDVMPTYHPAYLLRTPGAKREAWEDLKAVLKRLGKEIPRHN